MTSLFGGIYRSKRILITGHTGFKGSWLSLWLTMLGAEVIGISLDSPSDPDLFSILDLKKKTIHHKADIRNPAKITGIIRKEKPEIVFHFAARPIVRASYENPAAAYDVNIMGTVNLLEAIKTTDTVNTCIVASSDKCYFNKDDSGFSFKENDAIMGGIDPYSTSKACVELIVDSYRNSFFKDGISVSTVRSGNIMGGGDWGAYRLIPDCIKAIERNETIMIRNPDSIRPWIYILDSLSGYLQLCRHMMENPRDFNSGWNIGPAMINDEYKTGRIVEKIIGIYGKGEFEIRKQDFFEPSTLRIDTGKIIEKTGWRPVHDINGGITRSVEWYKRFYNNEDMLDLTMREISEYAGSISNNAGRNADNRGENHES